MEHNLLLIYSNFNVNSDCIQIIYNMIINEYANIIINSWFNHIQYKMNLFSNILTIPYLISLTGHYTYYSPFDPFVAYNFYKASRVITKYDDINTWILFFQRLNNFFKYVPVINFNDKCVKYSFDALKNFKKRIFYFY